MPLGNHLSSNQYVGLTTRYRSQDAFVPSSPLNTITIKAVDIGSWKEPTQDLLNLLGPFPNKMNILLATLGALGWY
jgi:hypothetical protein